MNQTHLPRSLVILLLFLVVGTFFVGTLRTFASAHVVTVLDDLAQKTIPPSPDENLASIATSTPGFPSPGPTLTPPPTTILPPPTVVETLMPTPAPTLTPTPEPESSADMTGIIALAILMVFVMLVSMAWGFRRPRNENGTKK